MSNPGSDPSIQPTGGFHASNERPWPDPTPEMLNGDPLFDAIWQTIKTWDINVPHAYSGYCGASGNHVRAIYDSLAVQGPPMLDSLKRELRIGSDYDYRSWKDIKTALDDLAKPQC